MMTTSKIYVACLASYAAGRLYGRHIEVTEPDEMQEQISALIQNSPTTGAEEWAVHDYEGPISDLSSELGEYPGLEKVCAWSELLDEHGLGFVAYLKASDDGDVPSDPNELRRDFESRYRGEWQSDADFARQWLEDYHAEDLASVSDEFRRMFWNYFDFATKAQELGCDYHFIRIYGPESSRVHVVSSPA